jgi:NAD(P)-dependent dehydrogenase (short-subunit alcohol dehydrogenase family)
MSEFDGKVAIITGASSGIGKRTAEMLSERGAHVVTFARSAGDVRGDVSDREAVERLFREAESRFGPCDVLVNNAGMIDPAPLVDTTPERWRRMFEVNVDGVFLACRRALPSMLQRRRGVIVNVASISGILAWEKFPGWVSYCASKAAVVALTEALAVEVKSHGVRVNAVSPGSVDTKMWAEASGGAPASMSTDEVAETILFLASERSRPINGQNLNVFSV